MKDCARDFLVEKANELLNAASCCAELKEAAKAFLDAAGKENDCIILHFIGRGAVPFGTESIFAERIERYQKCPKINKRYKRQQGENKFEFVLRQNNRNDDG